VKILGIVSESHDTGLAVLEDGVPTLVLEEERFSREKHTQRFPFLSLAAAMEREGLRLADIEAIATPWDQRLLRKTFLREVRRGFPRSLHLFRPSAHAAQDSGIMLLRFWLDHELKKVFGVRRLPPLIDVGHHDAHAAAFFLSPFDEAAVLVMDGYGDVSATSSYDGRGNRLMCHWRSGFFDSLGAMYTLFTRHLGFEVFEEGTVMALAACGDPRTYGDRVRKLVLLEEGGRFRLNFDYFAHNRYGMVRPFTRLFLETFGPARKREEPLTDHHRDLAAALQATIEEAVLHLARAAYRRRRSTNLVLSGGVALNCVANARLLRDTDFRRVWVPPCASDTGAPLGAALWYYHETLGKPRRGELTHPFLGLSYSDTEIEQALASAGLAFERLEEGELLARTARDIAAGKVVAWFQGRFEMGPRALGNRSILTDPRRPDMKDIINAKVKRREPFRPVAPAIQAEHVGEYFEIAQADPFMTLAPKVRPEKAALIPAGLHVDGTGRLQTVERAANPRFWSVIEEFRKLAGVPVVLNTSFNRHEPIVASPAEAVSCFLRSEMDTLVMGNAYIRDRNATALERARSQWASGNGSQAAGGKVYVSSLLTTEMSGASSFFMPWTW
jgi:carbamoyltransferase